MIMADIMVMTSTATSGMLIRDVFAQCFKYNVLGLPFVDSTGHIMGKISIRNTLKHTCLPDYLVKHAHLISNLQAYLHEPGTKIESILEMPIDEFLLEEHPQIESTATGLRAVALMEHFNTTYLFIVDNGKYKGIVTLMSIVKAMLEDKAS